MMTSMGTFSSCLVCSVYVAEQGHGADAVNRAAHA
jgi:hypothetical protein